ncbi:MAG: hypothetical protein E6J26_08465, partial [Chloroflexi bacterium]
MLALLLLACNTAPSGESPVALKILLSQPGIYRLTRADLQAYNFPDDLAHVRLTHHGADVPLELDASAVQFYAAPDSTLYSPTDAYWLTSGQAPLVMTARTVEPLHADPAATYTATLRLEDNKLYSASALGDTHWFWQSFTAPATRTVTASLNALGAGDAQLVVSLAGATEGNHAVQVAVNDDPAGETRWTGRESFVLTTTVSSLHVGDNAISLRALGEAGQAEV